MQRLRVGLIILGVVAVAAIVVDLLQGNHDWGLALAAIFTAVDVVCLATDRTLSVDHSQGTRRRIRIGRVLAMSLVCLTLALLFGKGLELLGLSKDLSWLIGGLLFPLAFGAVFVRPRFVVERR